MGTSFRCMLMPIGIPTGDGRKFAVGSISVADVPFPLEWARSRGDGHDGAVTVGVVQDARICTVGEAVQSGLISEGAVSRLPFDLPAVWCSGSMLDDADGRTTPRLAEDVAEVMTLAENGTLGPSVDPDSFEAVVVVSGTSMEPSEIDIENGVPLELLVTKARIRAATLVAIPAFVETSRPFELMPNTSISTPESLIASVSTTQLPPSWAFCPTEASGATPITLDRETGRVFGYLAPWGTCHVGYADACITAPRGGYDAFHRYLVETEDGPIWAGRITAGGRHPGLALTAAQAVSHYDTLTTIAYVRAVEDEHGIALAGIAAPGVEETALAILARRKISGDWRETAAGLSLVEVLALSPGPRQHSEPGFPVGVCSTHGRQTALTAAFGMSDPPATPDRVETETGAARVDVAAAVRAEFARRDLEVTIRNQAKVDLSAALND